jgi:xanthine dehydrogenase/oxidase
MNQVTPVAPKRGTAQAADDSNHLVFWLNGGRVVIPNPDPTVLLVEYLHSIGLTGTKVGCGQGGCGACTVMLSQRDRQTNAPVHRAVNACLKPLCAVDGMMVTTTEGIGNVHDGLDPIQYRIAAHNGTQCGYCTPGFVMTAQAFLQHQPTASQQELENIFGGNFCRCTGYRPILHGLRTFARDFDASKDRTQKCEIDPSLTVKSGSEFARINLDLLSPAGQPARSLHFSGGGREWYRPTSLAEVQRLKKQFVLEAGRQQVKLVFGNTSAGVYEREKPRFLIDISAIADLGRIAEGDGGIHVGASVPIQKLIEFVTDVIGRRPTDQMTGLTALKRHAEFIAGYQVRCAGSVAGNIFMTRDHAQRGAPFPSDLFTILATLGAVVTIASQDYEGGKRAFSLMDMPAVEALPEDAVLLSFQVPYTRPGEFVQTYRIARRVQMAHPIVNAGFRFRMGIDATVATGEATIVFGGLAAMTWRAAKTEQFLSGKAWNEETFRAALAVLNREVRECTIPMDEEGIATDYRRQLAENFFYKFFLHLAQATNPDAVAPKNRSAADQFDRPLSSGTQEHTEYPDLFPLSRPIIKRAAFVQASGEVKYTQDLSLPAGGLHAAVVKSTRSHAHFAFTKKAPTLDALQDLLRQRNADFRAFITTADIPAGGNNLIGLGEDDPVFSRDIVTSVGAPIGLAVAVTSAAARDAAEFIEQECIAYEDLPAVLTLDEAIAQNTAMPMIRTAADPDEDVQQRMPALTRAGSDLNWLRDPNASFPGAEVATGSLRTGAQAHFYLETMCALAVPGMYDQMTVYNSTQNPNGDQRSIARVLGTQANQITVIVEQIGGGFGGKQHRAGLVGAQAAVAARKLNRPVRLLYDRAADMQMVGKRHPYHGDYHIAYTPDGLIKGLHLDLKSDAGDTYDCSFAVMDLSLLQSDGCYQVDTLQANGAVYRTNKPSNTAFRTFGSVQPYAVFEDAVEQVAHRLTQSLGRRVLPEEIRRKNLYRTGEIEGAAKVFDHTHFGQDLIFCNIREIWDSLYESSDFEKRAAAVEQFNRANRWRKRGIAMIPQKYGIAFTEPRGSLNASSALVNVNMADGSVVVQHGGVEMGQGLNTKIAQLAANTLGIPLDRIRVAGINSDAIVNAPATAASTGYDLNGGAVELACRTLRSRLEDFCRDIEQFNPNNRIEHWRYDWAGSWPEIVFKAWFNRVNLSAAELYKSPHYKGPNERNPRGKPFLYFVYSASATEVELDVLTGEFAILRADILYDPGKSPNPAIDIGQLEGGYMQGVGFATTEELIYDDEGRLVTDNIWSYKPPCSKSIPLDFRVKLHPVDEQRGAREALAEKQAVKSSKAAGEPGLTLGLSAYFAIKRAVMDARRELTGRNDWLRMDLPATCQRIQTCCGVTTEFLTLGASTPPGGESS